MPSQNVGGGQPKGPGKLGEWYSITTSRGTFVGQYIEFKQHGPARSRRRQSRPHDTLTFLLEDGTYRTLRFRYLLEDARLVSAGTDPQE